MVQDTSILNDSQDTNSKCHTNNNGAIVSSVNTAQNNTVEHNGSSANDWSMVSDNVKTHNVNVKNGNVNTGSKDSVVNPCYAKAENDEASMVHGETANVDNVNNDCIWLNQDSPNVETVNTDVHVKFENVMKSNTNVSHSLQVDEERPSIATTHTFEEDMLPSFPRAVSDSGTTDSCNVNDDVSIINVSGNDRSIIVQQKCLTNNFKIMFLNVNGLKSKLKYGIIQMYMESFDIVCLTETKLDPLDEPNIKVPGFHPIFRHRKEFKVKSGGIMAFVKNDLKDCISEHKPSDNENALWLKFKETVLGVRLVLGIVYVPPTSSDYYTGEELQEIESDIIKTQSDLNCNICLVGDFNSRTSVKTDFIEIESIIANQSGIDSSNDMFINSDMLVEMNISPKRMNQDTFCDSRGDCFLEFCKANGLLIVNSRVGEDLGVGKTTCHKKTAKGMCDSTVDYALASPSLFKLLSNFVVDTFDPLMSDIHNPAFIVLSKHDGASISMLDHNNHDNSQVQAPPSQPPKASTAREDGAAKIKVKWDMERQSQFTSAFDSGKLEHVIECIKNTRSLENVSEQDINNLADKIVSIYREAGLEAGQISLIPATKNDSVAKYHANKLKRGSPTQPWFNADCEKQRRQMFRARHRKKRNATHENNSTLAAQSKAYKKQINLAFKQYHDELHKKLRNLKSKSPKDYWRILNKSSEGQSAMKNLSVQVFHDHFKKLNRNEGDNAETQADNPPSNLDTGSLNAPVSLDEVCKLSKGVKNNKASGLDNIINEFIKYSPVPMINLLTEFFNLVLESGHVPESWCTGVIVPIFKKKGDQNDPDNYRGITLLSCVGKVFTALLNNRISIFLDENNLLGEEQAGFRENYSTLDHIFSLYCIIDIFQNKNKRLYCAFVDYRKAFDSVDRSCLWTKLIKFGIQGKIFTVIQNMYTNAKSCIRLNGQFSDSFACEIGVRQGENLSPLLFSIFLNDLAEFLENQSAGISFEYVNNNVNVYLSLFTLMYADDTILLAESAEDLQSMLSALKQYCDTWRLKVNATKTKVVIFSRGVVRNYPKLFLGDDQLEVVKDYDYLGIKFFCNGHFHAAITKQATQAKRALHGLISKARRLSLPVDIMLELFDTCITPILLYGCEVWGFTKTDKVETFHNQFLKHLLHLGSRSINNMVLGETGRCKLEKTIRDRMLNFWLRLRGGKQSKISLALFNCVKQASNAGTHSSKWLQYIEDTLKSIELEGLISLNDTEIDVNHMKRDIRVKLNHKYAINWHQAIESSNTTSFYSGFKTKLDFESYLTLLEPKHRIPLCKFRCGNNYIPIVAGRFDNTPRQNRICTLCNDNEMGDEFHYMFKCRFFKKERVRYLSEDYLQCPNMLSMKKLMNSSEKQELINVAIFSAIIMKQFAP